VTHTVIPPGRPGRRGLRRLVPTWRQTGVGVIGGVILSVATFAVGYKTTTIPNPQVLATAQTTFITANDGHTVLGRLQLVNRVDVGLSQVPVYVQHAVLAAEDRHYYSEPGISITGIVRALLADIRGSGNLQGGSTITQQYAKNAFLTQQRTIDRKIKEIFLAIKLDHTVSKRRILDDYLNTIYFGRGAYGIEAASRAYFGRRVQNLTVAQGALLAGLIDAPSAYDPAIDAQAARARWQYVVNGMVTQGWLTSAGAARLRFPATKPPTSGTEALPGPDGFIVDAAEAELERHGFTAAQLAEGGYHIVTTIKMRDQRAAMTAEAQLHAAVPGPVSALVSVVPGTGAIRAYYGGSAYHNVKVKGSFIDLVRARIDPGSAFKPYVLVTALRQGIGLNHSFNGSSPQFPPGYPPPAGLTNAGNEQCNPCSLTEALYRSINTVFVPLGERVGIRKVIKTAREAGVTSPLSPVPSLSIGTSPVTALDQATGFSTIASGGIAAPPYLVAKVIDAQGHVVYRAHPTPHRVFSRAVTSDADYAMQQVLTNPAGTAYGKALAGRPAAGKTGTATNNANQNITGWFVGFTPQLCTAVWLANLNGSPLVATLGPGGELFGGGPPAQAWQTYMNDALAGTPVRPFPPPAPIGNFSPLPTAVPSPVAPSSGPPSTPPSPLPPPPTTTPPTRASSPPPTPPTTPPTGPHPSHSTGPPQPTR
jgi:membrane peptidoglycan carboxypeptidase